MRFHLQALCASLLVGIRFTHNAKRSVHIERSVFLHIKIQRWKQGNPRRYFDKDWGKGSSISKKTEGK